MLNYFQLGNTKSTKTLLFVHSAGANHKIFGEIQKYLENYNCILIDLNGHGESKGECSTTIEGYVNNVVDFIKNSKATKNQDNITLIGYSMGGAIVLDIALKKLPNIKKVVVLSSTSKFNKLKDTELMKKIHKTGEADMKLLAECLGNESNPLTLKYIQTSESDPKIIVNDLTACEKFDISNEIENINIPVKFIIARDEILVLLEYAERDNSKIKNSILTIFTTGRHFLPVVKGREIAKEINSFISD